MCLKLNSDWLPCWTNAKSTGKSWADLVDKHRAHCFMSTWSTWIQLLNDSAPTPRTSNCTSELFEDFVHKSLNQAASGNDCHFLPQVYYVFENGDYQHGKVLSRHILHLKRLNSEFPTLMARYGYQHVRLGAPQHPGRKCHRKHFSGCKSWCVLHDLGHPIHSNPMYFNA